MDGGSFPAQLGLYDCHDSGGNQFFPFAKSGEISTYVLDKCIGIKDEKVFFVPCSNEDKSQRWIYNYKVT